MSRRKLSAPQGRWNRCGSFDNRRTNARCMGPEKSADVIIFRTSRGWAPTSQPLHRHTRLPWWNNPCYYCNLPELNPPFKNPRSATDTGASYLKFKWTELQCSLVGKQLISNPSNIAIIIPSQIQLPAPMPPLVGELVPSSWTMCSVVAQKPNLWTAIALELAVITVTTLKMLESSVRVSTKITVFKYSDLLLTYYVLNQYTLQQQQMNLL